MNRSPDTEGIISDRDVFIAVLTNTIGVLTLTFPRVIAQDTSGVDGWLSIVMGGCIASFFAWVVTKISMSFPNQSFFSYASALVSKPVAFIMTMIFALLFIVTVSFNASEMSILSHQYLFDRTPREIISLTFLFVVIYAVSGSQVAIFRLNILFFPILIVGLLLVIFLPISIMHYEEMLPLFQTDVKGYIKATTTSTICFLGFVINFFYIALVKNPERTPKMSATAVSISSFCYLIIFIVCISVFGNVTTSNLFYPTFDLSRTVEIPGGFFDRFDVFLYVFWTIIFFTTAMMSFDIAVMALRMIFQKLKKFTAILILSPIIFYISMLPKNYLDLIMFNKGLGYFTLIYLFIVMIVLGVAFKVKGGNSSGK